MQHEITYILQFGFFSVLIFSSGGNVLGNMLAIISHILI
jgi:hypothetical protein